jgi:hypothetical protein
VKARNLELLHYSPCACICNSAIKTSKSTQYATANKHKFTIPPAFFGKAGPSIARTHKIQTTSYFCFTLAAIAFSQLTHYTARVYINISSACTYIFQCLPVSWVYTVPVNVTGLLFSHPQFTQLFITLQYSFRRLRWR